MPTSRGPPADPRVPAPAPHARTLIARRWRPWQRGGLRRRSPEDLALGPACMAPSSWSMGWLDSEKIQISATLTAASLTLLQRLSTCPPSAGCCSTCGAQLYRPCWPKPGGTLGGPLGLPLGSDQRGCSQPGKHEGQGAHGAGGQEDTGPVARPRGGLPSSGAVSARPSPRAPKAVEEELRGSGQCEAPGASPDRARASGLNARGQAPGGGGAREDGPPCDPELWCHRADTPWVWPNGTGKSWGHSDHERIKQTSFWAAEAPSPDLAPACAPH